MTKGPPKGPRARERSRSSGRPRSLAPLCGAARGRPPARNGEISADCDNFDLATRERPAERGKRRGADIVQRVLRELREARLAGDVSGRAMSQALGWSGSAYRRFECGDVPPALVDVSAAAVLLGLELSVSLHPLGQRIRDRGHQALIGRIRRAISSAFTVFAEAPLPGPHELRSWDLLLRLGGQRIGIEAETRIRDMQELVRHMRLRVRDGGADIVLLVLADTRTNRALVDELREALGAEFSTPPSSILRALKAGELLAGSGVVLI